MNKVVMMGALLTAACTTVPPEPGPAPLPTGQCDASRAQGLIGEPASQALAIEAQRLTGGNAVRWIQPGQAVTMDYRPDRINIKLDAQNRVTGITCG